MGRQFRGRGRVMAIYLSLWISVGWLYSSLVTCIRSPIVYKADPGWQYMEYYIHISKPRVTVYANGNLQTYNAKIEA